jgi:histidine ammonia-lyase
MTEGTFVLEPGRLSLAALRRIERDGVAIALAPECRDLVERARDLVNAIVAAGTPTYGVNTGLGTLSSRSIAPEDLEEMQSRLLLSNAAGTGALLSEAVVRRLMLLKINTLARGRSGVRPELIDALVSL